jgi:ABC-type polysaccharide/polyol phosphate transport system ATPase subunit
MMEDFAVKVENVSKTFKLPREKTTSIKSAVVNFYRRKKEYEVQKALDNISFEIKKGEFFGIVGRNGSGKSTLLKLLAGIYTPTSGQVHVRGSLTPFIELGVGFNPELTGRENVYLNGALLGFSRKEMHRMYKDIVDFAELKRFMDQKLKNYSSGMQVRLAFSIAIRAQSDILLIDEVLAVGDEAFQRKSINVFEKYKAQKRTIILVTHDMGVVERFCDRAMIINDGEFLKIGSPQEVAHIYTEINKNKYLSDKENKNDEIGYSKKINSYILDSITKEPKQKFKQGEKALIQLKWSMPGVHNAGVAIIKQTGEYIFGPNTYLENKSFHDLKEIFYKVRLDLMPGEYFLKLGLFGETDSDVLEFVDEGPSFLIEADDDQPRWGGLTQLEHKWGNKDVKL